MTEKTIGVVGLGYVGLPVAVSFAAAGFRVIGVDVSPDRVGAVNDGLCPFPNEPDLPGALAAAVAAGRLRAVCLHYGVLFDADAVIVCVATPVEHETRKPVYDDMLAALRGIRPVLKPGAMVIIESTLAPGTMRDIIGPELPDVALGHCPERLTAGRLMYNIRNMPRVCGAETPETRERMARLYENIVDVSLETTDWLTAEFVKVTENAYRDVNIAFANQVALLCEAAGADVWKVRELVNECPGRDMMTPGPGVGGHCIPKDTWLLRQAAPAYDDLLHCARRVNDTMPNHIAALALRVKHKLLSQRRAAILGIAYRANSSDTRNSPAFVVLDALRMAGFDVRMSDPFVTRDGALDWRKAVDGADVAILMTDHDAYREIDLMEMRGLMRQRNIIDGRRFWDAEAARAAGFAYHCIGVGERND